MTQELLRKARRLFDDAIAAFPARLAAAENAVCIWRDATMLMFPLDYCGVEKHHAMSLRRKWAKQSGPDLFHHGLDALGRVRIVRREIRFSSPARQSYSIYEYDGATTYCFAYSDPMPGQDAPICSSICARQDEQDRLRYLTLALPGGGHWAECFYEGEQIASEREHHMLSAFGAEAFYRIKTYHYCYDSRGKVCRIERHDATESGEACGSEVVYERKEDDELTGLMSEFEDALYCAAAQEWKHSVGKGAIVVYRFGVGGRYFVPAFYLAKVFKPASIQDFDPAAKNFQGLHVEIREPTFFEICERLNELMESRRDADKWQKRALKSVVKACQEANEELALQTTHDLPLAFIACDDQREEDFGKLASKCVTKAIKPRLRGIRFK